MGFFDSFLRQCSTRETSPSPPTSTDTKKGFNLSREEFVNRYNVLLQKLAPERFDNFYLAPEFIVKNLNETIYYQLRAGHLALISCTEKNNRLPIVFFSESVTPNQNGASSTILPLIFYTLYKDDPSAQTKLKKFLPKVIAFAKTASLDQVDEIRDEVKKFGAVQTPEKTSIKEFPFEDIVVEVKVNSICDGTILKDMNVTFYMWSKLMLTNNAPTASEEISASDSRE